MSKNHHDTSRLPQFSTEVGMDIAQRQKLRSSADVIGERKYGDGGREFGSPTGRGRGSSAASYEVTGRAAGTGAISKRDAPQYARSQALPASDPMNAITKTAASTKGPSTPGRR